MGRATGLYAVATLFAAAALGVSGCSSSGHTTAPGSTRTTAGPPSVSAPTSATPVASVATVASASSIAGRWTGTFTSTKYRATSGDFVVVFTQSGSRIGGTITIRPSCVPNATVSGSLAGTVATFGQVSGNGTVVRFTGTISATSMHGTYQSDARCGNDAGTWQAARS